MTNTNSIEENKSIARRVPEEVATEGNFDLVDEIFTEDAIEHGPFGDANGREAVKEQIENFRTAFDGFSATVDDIVAEGDTVAMRVTLRGTHEREFRGIEPTGKSIEVQNMVFTRIEDGKIAERWLQPDMLALRQQLGALPDEAART